MEIVISSVKCWHWSTVSKSRCCQQFCNVLRLPIQGLIIFAMAQHAWSCKRLYSITRKSNSQAKQNLFYYLKNNSINYLKIHAEINCCSLFFSLTYFGSSSVLFVLFLCGLLSHSRIFHSYEDVTITDERLQILSYAQHFWPLSSECFSACHSYCDTGLPFIMDLLVISEDPWHSHRLPSV